MKSLTDIQAEVARLAKIINALENDLPTFGYSEQSGRPHIEITDSNYYYVNCERGKEYKRIGTTDLNELIFIIFNEVTLQMAAIKEFQNRRENEDHRIQVFQIQEELINCILPEFRERLQNEHKKFLNKK
jgi:hypothetical protein